MAQKVVLVDDLDGSTENVETVEFGLDGQQYQIDLTVDHAQELRARIADFTAVARPLPKAKGAPRRTPVSSTDSRPKAVTRGAGRPSSSEVRAWARKKKIKVNRTGRLPQKLVDQYVAASQ